MDKRDRLVRNKDKETDRSATDRNRQVRNRDWGRQACEKKQDRREKQSDTDRWVRNKETDGQVKRKEIGKKQTGEKQRKERETGELTHWCADSWRDGQVKRQVCGQVPSVVSLSGLHSLYLLENWARTLSLSWVSPIRANFPRNSLKNTNTCSSADCQRILWLAVQNASWVVKFYFLHLGVLLNLWWWSLEDFHETSKLDVKTLYNPVGVSCLYIYS